MTQDELLTEYRRRGEEIYRQAQERERERLKESLTPRQQRLAKARLEITPEGHARQLLSLDRYRGSKRALGLTYEEIRKLIPDLLDFPEFEYGPEQLVYIQQRLVELESRLDFTNPVIRFQVFEAIDEELHVIDLRRRLRCVRKDEEVVEKSLDQADRRLMRLYEALNLLERQKGKPEEFEPFEAVQRALDQAKRSAYEKTVAE